MLMQLEEHASTGGHLDEISVKFDLCYALCMSHDYSHYRS